MVHCGGVEARRKNVTSHRLKVRKLKAFSGSDFARRWRRIYSVSQVGVNIKVVARSGGYATVSRAREEMERFAGGKLRKWPP